MTYVSVARREVLPSSEREKEREQAELREHGGDSENAPRSTSRQMRKEPSENSHVARGVEVEVETVAPATDQRTIDEHNEAAEARALRERAPRGAEWRSCGCSPRGARVCRQSPPAAAGGEQADANVWQPGAGPGAAPIGRRVADQITVAASVSVGVTTAASPWPGLGLAAPAPVELDPVWGRKLYGPPGAGAGGGVGGRGPAAGPGPPAPGLVFGLHHHHQDATLKEEPLPAARSWALQPPVDQSRSIMRM
ncbi:uncharacterized protein LOC126120995 [Schistocerca cancellata]|uniref:uncharacterized protein LOC126120995 n=1 Tax=Schistocerca cancellata TaxID=274614 RepID=UPI0021178AC6|nr:uncharacterized protein LOC126120995 [Schistocerca cancellata]